MRRCASLKRNAQLRHLPLQSIKHRLTCGQRGLAADLRAPAQSQPRPLCGLSRAYAIRAPPAKGTQPGLLALFLSHAAAASCCWKSKRPKAADQKKLREAPPLVFLEKQQRAKLALIINVIMNKQGNSRAYTLVLPV